MQTLTEGGGGGDQQAFSWLITLTMPNGSAANLMITLAHNMACHDKKYIALVLRAARLGNSISNILKNPFLFKNCLKHHISRFQVELSSMKWLMFKFDFIRPLQFNYLSYMLMR